MYRQYALSPLDQSPLWDVALPEPGPGPQHLQGSLPTSALPCLWEQAWSQLEKPNAELAFKKKKKTNTNCRHSE